MNSYFIYSFFRHLKVSLVPSVSPSNWSFTTKSVSADADTPYFGDNFPVAVPKSKLSTKTLQVTIWTSVSDPEGKSTCVGSAQISLADFDWETVSVRWYNVLQLQYIFQQPPGSGTAASMASKAAVGPLSSKPLLTSGVNSALSSNHGTLKEESSDDSTIISSQASTLTRTPNDVMTFEVDDLDPEVVIPSEPLMHLMSIGKKLCCTKFLRNSFNCVFWLKFRKHTT